MVAYTIYQAHFTYVTLNIALNIQCMSLTSPVYTYLHAGTGLCTSFNKVTYSKYSFNICLEL